MKRKLTAGITSVSLPIFVQDTSSTTGAGLGSLTPATSGLVAEYRRHGSSSWTSITLVGSGTKTLGTWTSGGFIADGSLTGAYELDLPDAVLAAGARWVAVRLRGAANMLPVLIEIELDAVNYQDAAGFGLSRLDAAITSRLASASYTAPDNVNIGVAAIQASAAATSAASVDGKLTTTRAGYLDAAISSRLQSSFGTTITQIHNATKMLPPSLGILGFVGFFAREEVGTPTADQLVAEEVQGLPLAAGQYIVLGLQIDTPPGTPSGLIWQITAVADALITMTPVGHTTTVQAWLGSESTASQGVVLAANSPLLGAYRVMLALPAAGPAAVQGLVTRSYLDVRTSASTGTAVSAFLSMVENYTGSLYRFLAPALALAPTGSGGGPGALADADIDWSFSARPTTGGAFILQALSVEYLKASATAFVGERQIDPTAYAVEFAFVTSSSALGAATWHECEWDENGLARLLVGPGEVELTAGAYYWYVRVTSSPETSLQRLDPILRVE